MIDNKVDVEKKTSRISNIIMAVLFILVLFLLGFGSDIKLIDYYKNREKYRYNEVFTADLGPKNETEYNTVFVGKMHFIDANGLIRNILNQKEMNGTIKLNNGYLTITRPSISEDTLKWEADQVGKLYRNMSSRNIPFLYVTAPDKISKYDPEIPTGIEDYSNRNIDVFLKEIKKQNVPYLDLRYEMKKDGINQYDMFFKTDHHWTTDGGFYAYNKIKNWVETNSGIRFNSIISNSNNYKKEVYKNVALGTHGQRTGKYFGGSDDIKLYIPKFKTDIMDFNLEKRGTFEDILLDKTQLDVSEPSFVYDNTFTSYGSFENMSSDNDITIMVIDDSFGRVVNPYLVLSTKKFYWYSSYDGKAITDSVIDEINPDLVILMQSPGNNYGSDYKFDYQVQ